LPKSDRPTERVYLTPGEAISLLRVCHSTLSRWVEQGHLPNTIFLPSGQRRYAQDDILAASSARTRP
jgi:predicted site-specific integrase-resolvase